MQGHAERRNLQEAYGEPAHPVSAVAKCVMGLLIVIGLVTLATFTPDEGRGNVDQMQLHTQRAEARSREVSDERRNRWADPAGHDTNDRAPTRSTGLERNAMP